MIELRKVSKRFADHTAVHPLDLRVEAGETLVLIGPSGCGKSTLIRLMVGLIEPDAGEVFFQGERVTQSNATSLRQKMGYVIQRGGLFPHLTVHRNVTLMAERMGWSAPKCNQRIDELLTLSRFPGDLLERYPSQLSGGQRQRASLMRALMLDPDVLFFDEPLGALDPLVRAALQQDLRKAFSDLKKTVVLVTHDMGEAWYLGDRVCLLRGGRILQQGRVEELVSAPADLFVTRFINAQRSPLAAEASAESQR